MIVKEISLKYEYFLLIYICIERNLYTVDFVIYEKEKMY